MLWLGAQAEDLAFPGRYWRSLHYFNLYRLVVSGVFVATFVLFGPVLTFGSYDPGLFFMVSLGYAIFSAVMTLFISSRRPEYLAQLHVQVGADFIFQNLLMFASGGVESGLGALPMVSLAVACVLGQGRHVLTYAALASLLVLAGQVMDMASHGAPAFEFLPAGLLCTGFFALAGLALVLSRRLRQAEREAASQQVDLANLGQVNQLIIEAMQEGVLVVDGDNRVKQYNQQVVQLFQAQHVQLDQQLESFAAELSGQLTHWRETTNHEPTSTHMQVNGRSLRSYILPVGSERAKGAVIFIEDLSRIQEQAQQLKLAALGRLTANLAHEIRNPLGAIGHAIQLLQEEPAADATAVRLLQIIHDNTLRLDQLVKDVLSLNRQDRTHRQQIPLAAWLTDFIRQFMEIEHIPAECIEVAVEQVPAIYFDEHHLHRILWNLCQNAWRYCRRLPGSIIVRAYRQPYSRQLCMDILDDGGGVPAHLQAQLFEPFFTTAASGTGLGLYIARELCEANGASLEYISRPQGALFRIRCKEETK